MIWEDFVGKMMSNKKIYLIFISLLLALNSIAVFADPIIELSAPRMATPKIIGDDGSAVKPTLRAGAKKISKSVKNKSKKRVFRKKTYAAKLKPVKVNYDKIAKMIEYGYYDSADKILQSAIARNPNDVESQALLAVSYAKQTKLDPAQKALNILLKKYPNNSNLHYAQGIVYYQRTSSSNVIYRNNTPKLTGQALSEFKKAIALDKNSAEAYNAAGVISLNLGNQKDATDYFQKALLADKSYSLAIDNLGTIDFLNRKYSDAEKKYTQALAFNSQNTTAMYHMAQIAMQKREYALALHYLNQALSLNSNSPAIYNLMGKAYVSQGNDAAAINAFKKSVSVKPEFAPSYYDLADIYQRRGDLDFAVEKLKSAIVLEPNFYDAKLKLADISLSNGDYSHAIEVYSELVGINNYKISAIKGLANAYYVKAQNSSNKASLGSNSELLSALDSINKAISVNNQDLELYLAKARLMKIVYQPESSETALTEIIKNPANDLGSLIAKGEANLALYDYSNAQKNFDLAIGLSKTPQDDLYLSEIFILHKQFDCAQKVLVKILKNDSQNQEALGSLEYIQKSKKNANNYYNAAITFIKSKNQSAAVDYLSRSLALNPNNSQAQLLLAGLEEKQKNYQYAVVNYKAYLGLAPNARDAKAVDRKIRNLENRL